MSSGEKKLKIHLTGGEGAGWALDQDLSNTRKALEQLSSLVDLVNIEDADIVHTVWTRALDRIAPELLAEKFVVCHICTNTYKMLEQPSSIRYTHLVDLWVAQSSEAAEAADRLDLPHVHVPYAMDGDIFFPDSSGKKERQAAQRSKLGLQPDAFLIGNFMRDSLGLDLNTPKPEKGADIFLELLKGMKKKGLPIHVLLAGPRRHWIRRQLTRCQIPFTFIGEQIEGDDVDINVLPLEKIAELHHLVDLVLVTSRHEGGPRTVLEAAATKTAIVSTPVGLARDILHPKVLFTSLDDGINKIAALIKGGYPAEFIDSHRQRVVEQHSIDSVAQRFAEVYRDLSSQDIPSKVLEKTPLRLGAKNTAAATFPQVIRKGVARLRGRTLPGLGMTICLWHEFHKPPYGGGNQFMMALKKGLQQLGVKVVSNRLDDSIDVHICNAVWFDPALIEKLSSTAQDLKVIHRLDGLVHIARGHQNKSIDEKAYDFNRQFATATVMQSEWCLRQAKEMGYTPSNPVIIRNACNAKLFYPNNVADSSKKKWRIIATSWSDNPMKGSELYKKIESRLDWTKFDFTFVGRTKQRFERIKVVKPLPSAKLAAILREHDIYITASKNEACSNALIEALACGLPALYLNNSSNPEVVGWGGIPFNGEEDLLDSLDQLVHSHEGVRHCIRVDSLQDIAMKYLELAQEICRL